MPSEASFNSNDYSSLKKLRDSLISNLEDIKQELHVVTRNTEVIEATNNDLQAEIKDLQLEESAAKRLHKDKLASDEDRYNAGKSRDEREIQKLQSELSEKEKLCVEMKTSMEMFKRRTVAVKQSNRADKLREEINRVKLENDNFQASLEDSRAELERLKNDEVSLSETAEKFKIMLDELKENLSCIQENIREQKDLVQKLSEENVILRTDLESYKTQHAENRTKGNSLFAEVDDRRVDLETAMQNIQLEKMSLEKELNSLKSDIHQYESELRKILQQWKKDVFQRDELNFEFEKSFKNQIKSLNSSLEQYKKELEMKPFVCLPKQEFAESFTNSITLLMKEVDDLKHELSSHSLETVKLWESIKETEEKARDWKFRALEANLKLDKISGNDS